MGKIIGNDNEFPTIKQVNDALNSIINGIVNLFPSMEFYDTANILNVNMASTMSEGRVIFNTNTNCFCYEVIINLRITYYNNWAGSKEWGTTSIYGVIPKQNTIYKAISNGKYYIYDSTTLVEF